MSSSNSDNVESFHGFIGQRKTVNHLRTQMRGAQALGQVCPHLLIVGPSGMGKTRLTKALAAEAGVTLHIIHGKTTISHLASELLLSQKGDFLFLDEAHTLPKECQEALYEVIDGSVISVKAQGSQNKAKEAVPPVTVVLATNQPSEILEALHRRMEITVLLDEYEKSELMEIVGATATNHSLLFSQKALGRVALACQGQPRRALQIVHGMKRHFSVGGEVRREMQPEDVVTFLKTSGRDSRGLDREQQIYIKKLYTFGRASLATLAGQIGLDKDFVADKVEPGLVRLGLVCKGMGGRFLSELGARVVRKKLKLPPPPEGSCQLNQKPPTQTTNVIPQLEYHPGKTDWIGSQVLTVLTEDGPMKPAQIKVMLKWSKSIRIQSALNKLMIDQKIVRCGGEGYVRKKTQQQPEVT